MWDFSLNDTFGTPQSEGSPLQEQAATPWRVASSKEVSWLTPTHNSALVELSAETYFVNREHLGLVTPARSPCDFLRRGSLYNPDYSSTGGGGSSSSSSSSSSSRHSSRSVLQNSCRHNVSACGRGSSCLEKKAIDAPVDGPSLCAHEREQNSSSGFVLVPALSNHLETSNWSPSPIKQTFDNCTPSWREGAKKASCVESFMTGDIQKAPAQMMVQQSPTKDYVQLEKETVSQCHP